MVSRELLERVRDYLNEMFKDKIKSDPKYLYWAEGRVPYLKNVEWHVGTNYIDGVGVMGLIDGRIEVHSHVLGENFEEALEIITADLYRPRLEKAKSEEKKKKIQEERREEIRRVLDDLINKRWEKYVKDGYLRRCYGGFESLYWGKRLRGESGINTV